MYRHGPKGESRGEKIAISLSPALEDKEAAQEARVCA